MSFLRTPRSLAHCFKLTAAALLLNFAPGLMSAATAPDTGIIAGHVVDAVNHVAIGSARVVIPELGRTAVTNEVGEFSFGRVPPGHYHLQVTYAGYPSVTDEIDVTAGAAVSREVTLGNEIVQLEAFKVQGSAEGQARAVNQQKNADNLKSVVASDAIGNFPDAYAADALQRLPGITIDRDQGEGRNVVIRGIESSLNNVMIDGQRAPGADRQTRKFELDSIPVAFIDSIEVTKAVTPDMDATAIGGTVNIRTPSAFTRGRRTLLASARYGYNELGGGDTYQGSLTYGDIFGAQRNFGVLLSASYQDSDRETDDQEADWSRVKGSPESAPQYFMKKFELRDYHITRVRRGYSSNIDYRLSDATSLYLRGQYTTFKDYELRPGLQLNLSNLVSGDATGGETTGGDARRLLQETDKRKLQYTIAVGGETRGDGSLLSYRVNRGYAKQDTVQDDQWQFRNSNGGINYKYTLGEAWHPRIAPTNGKAIDDPALFAFNSLQGKPELTEEEETGGKIDYQFDRDFGARAGTLKFGAKYTEMERSNDQRILAYGKNGTAPLLSQFSRPGRNDFLDGRFDFGPVPDSVAGYAFIRSNPDRFKFTSTTDSIEDYNASERVLAGYGMGTVDFGKLRLVGGVRVETTETEFGATNFVTGPSGLVLEHTNSKVDYTHVLPGLQARYARTDNLIFRAAWTNTIARPKFAEISPAAEVDEADLEISRGNPDLKPAESMNFDLSAEWYLPPVGVVSVGAFYKDIKNLTFEVSSDVQNPTGLTPGTYELTTFENAEKARLLGLELSWQQQLAFLPAPFDGFLVNANYTFTDSYVRTRARPGVDLPFFKQSDNAASIALGYKKGRIDARLAWVYRDAFFIKLGSERGLDFYSDPSVRLDFTARVKLTDHVSLVGDVLNITDDPFTRYLGSEQRPIQAEYYGLTASLGVQCSF